MEGRQKNGALAVPGLLNDAAARTEDLAAAYGGRRIFGAAENVKGCCRVKIKRLSVFHDCNSPFVTV